MDYNKYVLELDEFDLILNVIGNTHASKQEPFDYSSLVLLSDDERKQILGTLREKKTTSALDMSYLLLQKLDGIECANGRIIVATTNHIEKINPALLRPGCFDLKLCLSYCSSQMVVDILSFFYKCDKQELDVSSIPEHMVTPVELINLAIQSPNAAHVLREIEKTKRIETNN